MLVVFFVAVFALLVVAMVADSRGRTRMLKVLTESGQLTQERFDALMGHDQRRALAITLAIALALLAALIIWAIIYSHLLVH